MRRIPKLLSKTKLMRGFRCHKCLYLTIHQPELEPPVTPELQALFDQGNEVGALARTTFPGGTLVDCKPWEFGDALARTRELIAAGVETIYEAAFEYQGCYARTDILQYSRETKRFTIYEVKSTTSVKQEHLEDAGLQTWIMAKSGLPIEKVFIMHLNRECRFPHLENLFIKTDVTEAMRVAYPTVTPKIKSILDCLCKSEVPAIDLGPYCLQPTPCPFVSHCWQKIPTPSIFDMPGMRERKWDLYQAGIVALDDPRLTDLTEIQQRIVNAYKSGERFVDASVIKALTASWQYPFIYLDFETIGPAIPRYVGTGPYQQVPFQFSVHQQAQPDAELVHHEFLHMGEDDPRPALITALLAACGTTGSIIAYYGKFESSRIEELAEFSPTHREALLALIDRIVDPLPVLRDAVYDNAFGGSFSLKKVAPALLGEAQSYADMTVSDGGAAQRAYAEMISAKTSAERKSILRNGLLEYCKKDTLVMVELVNWMLAT